MLQSSAGYSCLIKKAYIMYRVENLLPNYTFHIVKSAEPVPLYDWANSELQK